MHGAAHAHIDYLEKRKFESCPKRASIYIYVISCVFDLTSRPLDHYLQLKTLHTIISFTRIQYIPEEQGYLINNIKLELSVEQIDEGDHTRDALRIDRRYGE